MEIIKIKPLTYFLVKFTGAQVNKFYSVRTSFVIVLSNSEITSIITELNFMHRFY